MSALITGILRIIHPEMYLAGYDAMKKVAHKFPDFAHDIDQWGHPFTAISAISNRQTPVHQDTKSRIPYYDILSSFSPFPDSRLEYTHHGIKAYMKPGGFAAFCGFVMPHKAMDCAGDRLCCAWYMRRSIHAAINAMPAPWMDQKTYFDCLVKPLAIDFPLFY